MCWVAAGGLMGQTLAQRRGGREDGSAREEPGVPGGRAEQGSVHRRSSRLLASLARRGTTSPLRIARVSRSSTLLLLIPLQDHRACGPDQLDALIQLRFRGSCFVHASNNVCPGVKAGRVCARARQRGAPPCDARAPIDYKSSGCKSWSTRAVLARAKRSLPGKWIDATRATVLSVSPPTGVVL
jgi:hypothetical protein